MDLLFAVRCCCAGLVRRLRMSTSRMVSANAVAAPTIRIPARV
jgi:hypothetical protein